MTKPLALLVSFLALGLVASGCGSSDKKSSGSSGSSSGAAAKPAPAAGGKTAQVTMKDIQFDPRTVSVAKGGTVEWKNDDSVGHDVTSRSGPQSFKSGGPGGIGPGATFKQTFTKPGTYKYVCTVHAGMSGQLDVK